jgi:3-oxoacyl-[acyl-carrier-protein] synthase-3
MFCLNYCRNYTKHIHKEDKETIIFGDAAAATIISTDGLYEINEFSLGTDGSGAQISL